MKMRYKASQIPSLKDKTVFFDANALIYIFWSTDPENETAIDYGSIFSVLLKNEIKLAINETVISEIINRVLRLEFEKTKESEESVFKEYRDSETGKKVQEDIHTIIRTKILKTFDVISESFSKDDIDSFMEVSKLDFNDKLIEHICISNNLVLLTHDFDFSDSNADILTANDKLRVHH